MTTLKDFPLAILAKAPVPGQVKTRLMPRLGAEGATRLHRQLVWQTLETAVAATEPASITLWTSLASRGGPEHAFFDTCAEHFGIRLCAQPNGSLGLRMQAALVAMPGPGLVIGCDCPMLDAALLQQCRAILASSECVLLPAEDGGYALIGAHQADSRLFQDIDWGTERVLTQTLERLHELGWSYACPTRVWDLDRPDDLERLLSLPNPERWREFVSSAIDTQ
ncbi:TIGR04282 family arsenosugar biosynthesis glycosyltransferase [Halomonas sp. M20]|uniref:TIGR04282 family arsenosugar biosynthesis glycosyltransferase n=1 Tax=Halomonas sp. M20 TaxID=2763264 RepID=UPI001D0A9ACC|nr:TIGR04282 family arsenosugar biosynthesis glycosyltransferase [Halomonas sp. M20]